ncbi:hypothetical protein GCG54_00012881 [Colletotrichum gloeosporioides]|uniref:Uncharacterized protein n=1 Tax=Colletotrichum gloeosporioides TaxID=474922 RepID=A0A8H4CT72_COLGL|nr:uncharacterized protein GCG54_00012881 [Colletotrichum gloeosporioides]KAF3809595.1 hypothetical protein GCG54_00012881 [Colletotrichum gloeosporioides]
MAQKQFESQAQAALELQSQITTAVGRLNFPGGLGSSSAEVAKGINQKIDAKAFHKHNQSGIVEAHAYFVATKSDGKQAFELKVIWDADNPPVGKTQTAHFGWEIYLDGKRVAGPGHVFFAPDVILPNYRNNKRDQVEVASLRLSKSGGIGTGQMQSTTNYYRLE